MHALPSITVINFFEWVLERQEFGSSKLSILYELINDYNKLYRYAREYLKKREIPEAFEKRVHNYFRSSVYYNLCKRKHRNMEKYYERLSESLFEYISKYSNYDLEQANDNRRSKDYREEASHLVDSFIYYFRDEQSNELELLVNNSEIELSEELSFLEWMAEKEGNAEDLRKMPYDIYVHYVDNYINENNKGIAEKKRLLNDYQLTGWRKVFEEIKVLFGFKARTDKSISDMLARYLNSNVEYKCIILPLSDSKSQEIYRKLINDSWKDLNSCTGNYMDIYYSESDTGKSGFDIANELYALPDKLRTKAPCLIIWKNGLNRAMSISINDLDNLQLVELIRTIVEDIQADKEFGDIIVKGRNKVKEMRDSNKGVNNYYAPNVNGNNNIIGNNIVAGDGNATGKNSFVTTGKSINNDKSILLKGFDNAIILIKDSEELNDEMKTQLNVVMKMAKSGIENDSKDQQENAKSLFGTINAFLPQVAPVLLQALANIATIATFFGLAMHS